MSDEAGSVSVSILGDLKPFEEALREVERRAEAAVKRIEAVTGKIRFAPLSGGRSSVSGVDELEAATKKAEQFQRSLTRELAREGNAQAAEVKRSLREQDRALEESARKQAHLRAVLARDFKRASNEQIDDARRLAKELEAAQKPINVSRARSAANAGQAKWNEWAGIRAGGSGDAARSANVFKAVFTEEAAARKKSTEDARSAASEKAKIDRAISESMKSAVNEEVASQRRAAAEKKAIYDKEVADRKRLAAAMLQDANEQAAINRRIAAEQMRQGGGANLSPGYKRFLAQDLTFQLNDVISGIAMGQKPGMIAAQQGGQIYDVFQRGGGIGPTLKIVGDQFKGLVNPVFLATAAIGGMGIIAGTAAYKFSEMTRRLDNAGQLTGRVSGATGAALYGISSKQGDLSTSQAAGAVSAFASAGVDVDLIDSITSRVKRFSQATGKDAVSSAEELATALQDPAKGVDELAKSMGGFDVVVIQNIKNLAAQGDRFGAQKALIEALSSALDKAKIEINNAANGWDRIGRAISNIYNATGKGVSEILFGKEDEDRLSSAKKTIEEIDKLRNYKTKRGQSISGEDEAELASAKAVVSELEKKRDAAKAAADSAKTEADIQFKAAGIQKSGYDILGLTPKQDLNNQLLAYQALINATGSVAAAAKAANMSENDFIEAVTRSASAARDAVGADEKLVDQHKAAIEMIKARTDAEKILAAQHAAAASGLNTTEDVERAKKFAADQITAARTASASDMLRNANDNAASAGMSGLPKTLADINAKYAEQIRLAEGNTEAIRKLIAAREQEKATATIDATSGPTRDATLAINEQVAATRIQAATFGAGAAAIAEATKRQELYNQYAREGVAITPELADGIEKIARAAGHAAKEENDLNKAQKRIIEDANELRDAGGGFLKTFISDLARGKSGVEALKDAINSLMQKLLDRVENSFIDMLFGKSGSVPGGADDKSIFGGALGKLLGADKQAPAAAVANGSPLSIVPGNNGNARIDQAFGLFGGNLASDRSKFELNDEVTNKLFSMTKAEVGGQGPQAQQAFMESIFNRSSSRGKTIEETLSDRGYFPKSTFDNAASASLSPDEIARYRGILGNVRGGSNISGFATGNASGTVGFGGGPTTFSAGGERFGIEKFDTSWAKKMQTMDPSKLNGTAEALSKLQTNAAESATNLTSLGTGATQVTSALTGAGGMGSGGGGLGGLLGGILSLFKFEDGGIMTSSGPMPLRKYADGGVANSPQLAMFGEGSGPEAYVPLKNGGIPVRISGPKQATATNFAQTNISFGGSTINIEGSADMKTLDLMRQELDIRDRRISKDLDRSFGTHQRAYSALRAR